MEDMDKELLIIFVKPPEVGKVKTRLAKSVGSKKALSIYNKLLEHTHKIVKNLPQDICIAYSGDIVVRDVWDKDKYQKVVQQGGGLGEKMSHAFDESFNQSYQQICLIGSDIYELTPSILKEAFRSLKHHDLVIGPSSDGGYYLVGMNQFYGELFEGISWSTEQVLQETLKKARLLKLNIDLLPTLNDIDELEDIRDEDRDYLLS